MLIIITITSISCKAANFEALTTPNTYNNTEIRHNTLFSLMPSMPQSIDINTINLDPKNPNHVNQTQNFIDKNNQTWLAKISGTTNRTYTQLHTQGATGEIFNNINYLKERLDHLKKNPITSHQTASHAAYYLIAKATLEKHNLSSIALPETYLHSTEQNNIDDNHAILIQQHIEGTELHRNNNISDEQLKQLFSLVEHVGLWHIEVIVGTDNKLYPIDLEQPNNTDENYFFHQDPNRYHGNLICGIKDGLFKIFEHNPEKCRLLAELVSKSKIINHENFNKNYQNEILNFVQKHQDS